MSSWLDKAKEAAAIAAEEAKKAADKAAELAKAASEEAQKAGLSDVVSKATAKASEVAKQVTQGNQSSEGSESSPASADSNPATSAASSAGDATANNDTPQDNSNSMHVAGTAVNSTDASSSMQLTSLEQQLSQQSQDIKKLQGILIDIADCIKKHLS